MWLTNLLGCIKRKTEVGGGMTGVGVGGAGWNGRENGGRGRGVLNGREPSEEDAEAEEEDGERVS